MTQGLKSKSLSMKIQTIERRAGCRRHGRVRGPGTKLDVLSDNLSLMNPSLYIL